MTITPEQSRAARGLINWDQGRLAGAANVSRNTIVFFENGRREPGANNLAAIRTALEKAGVEFTRNQGVQKSERVPFLFGNLKFSKKELEALPRHELDHLVAGGLASNDLAIFSRLKTMVAHKPSESEIVTHAVVVNNLMLFRHIVSKVVEFVKLIEAFETRCKRQSKGQQSYPELFDSAKRVSTNPFYEFACDVRNDITNHYLAQKLFDSLDGFPDDHVFTMVNHQVNGNSLSLMAEEISFLPRFTQKNVDFGLFEQWIVEEGKALTSAHQHWGISIFKRYFPDKKLHPDSPQVEGRFVGTVDDTIPILLTF